MIPPDTRPFAETAIAALQQILDDDSMSHADLARAMRCVVALRNRLIDDKRNAREVGRELDEVNALLSLGHGAEYPLLGFHRDRIEKLRQGLRHLLTA